MKRPGFLIPALVLASLFFGWRAYDAWTGPMKSAAAAPSAPVAPIGISAEEEPPAADLHVFAAAVAAKPVFRPDRRPFREESAQAARRNYDSEISRFTLLGVLLQGENTKGVVVGKGVGGRDERWEVRPGDELPGFIVKEIGADGITLAADGREFQLPLYAGGPKGPSAVRTEVAPRGSASAPGQAASPSRPAGVPAAAAPPRAAAPPGAASPPAVSPPAANIAPSALDTNFNRTRLRRQIRTQPPGTGNPGIP